MTALAFWFGIVVGACLGIIISVLLTAAANGSRGEVGSGKKIGQDYEI